MNNHKNILEKALKERKIEKELKDYFKKMDSCFGEDYSSLILSSAERPSDSLYLFTSRFPKISDTDIILALIKSHIYMYI